MTPSCRSVGALLLAEPSPEKVLGEIGRRGDAHQRVDARPRRERGEQHDPGAHARPDEEQRSPRARREDRERIVAPRADRPVDEPPRRAPVALIVEPEEGAGRGRGTSPRGSAPSFPSCRTRSRPGRRWSGRGRGGRRRRAGRRSRRRGTRRAARPTAGATAHAGLRGRRPPLPPSRDRRPEDDGRAAGSACTRCTGSAPAGSSRWRRGDPSPRGGRRSRRPWRRAPRCRSCRRRSARS